MSQILPVGGGKGGIGKSFIASNLGALLAASGKKVLIVDLDLGGSNLHTFFGLGPVTTGLHKFLGREVDDLANTTVHTGIPNLSLISSSECSMEIANLPIGQKIKIIKALRKLDYDYILLDLGAGTHYNTLDLFLTSSEGLIICAPEPTSIENAFRFIKAVYFRKLKQIIKQQNFNAIVKIIAARNGSSLVRPDDIIDFVSSRDKEKGEVLRNALSEFKFHFIINQFRKETDPDIGEKMAGTCNRHFFSKFDFLGNLGYDSRVHDAIYAKTIFINKYPYTLPAEDLKGISRRLLSM